MATLINIYKTKYNGADYELDLTMSYKASTFEGYYSRPLHHKHYELSDHLGNVRAVVTSGVRREFGLLEATLVASTNYYPFGMTIGSLSENSEKYRFGFQGQENDQETGFINYKYRMHDPRIGRFFAVDPLTKDYPWNSPYAFSENRLIDAAEFEGLEKIIYTTRSKELFQKFQTVMKSDEVLTCIYNSITKPELRDKIYIYFATTSSLYAKGQMRNADQIKSGLKWGERYLNDADMKNDQTYDYLRDYATQRKEIGISFKTIADREKEGIKQFLILINDSEDTQKDHVKNALHEAELHLKNAIQYELSGDEKYNQTPGQEHKFGYGEAYYRKTGEDPERTSPPKGQEPEGSHMKGLYDKVDEVW